MRDGLFVAYPLATASMKTKAKSKEQQKTRDSEGLQYTVQAVHVRGTIAVAAMNTHD